MAGERDPDAELMLRVKKGDAQAFEELVDKYKQPILNFVYRTLRDSPDMEDIAQNVFIQVFKSADRYRVEAKFSTWLWRIALNHCYDELRRTKRRSESSLDDDSAAEFPCLTLAPDDQTASDEECALVRASLLRLPEISRTVLAFRYCEGLKLREISEILDLPESTIHSRIAVALAQITRILEPQMRDHDDPRPKRFPQVVL